MPAIDDALLPAYGDLGLRALSVYAGEQTAFGQALARDAEIGFPMIFDIDWPVFERYRLPDHVMPLSVVIGRDGRVVHVDGDGDLAAAEAAILDAL